MPRLGALALGLAITCPGLAQARTFSEKTLTWKKPEIYLGHREPCLEYAQKNKVVLLDAELIEDLGTSIRVKCHLVR